MSLVTREVQRRPERAAAAGQVGRRVSRSPQAMRRVGLEERLVLLLLLAVCAADLGLLWVGLDALDEGYFLEQAGRVLHGAVPYRDFDTLYTPGLLYLHAALLGVTGGLHVLPLRAVGLLARVALSTGLYLLCRPLVRPAFAIFPGLYVLVGLDRTPSTWEPHPGWPSAAVVVLTVCLFARLPTLNARRRQWWLVGIGAATAVVFAFKQNTGVFLGIALVLFSAWQGVEGASARVTRPLRVAQIVLLLAIVLAVTGLIQPHASLAIAAYFVGPIVVVGVAALRSVSVSSTGRSLRSWVGTLALFGVGFSAVSVVWIGPLVYQLDGRVELLKGFVGAVNQDILWYPLQAPAGGAWASLLGVALAAVAATRARRHRMLCVMAFGTGLVFATCGVLLSAQPGESAWFAVAAAPARAADGLALFLPLIAIGLGAWWSFRSPPTRAIWRLRWMTVASTLILLTEYPRVDEVHLAWSACLALATGAVVVGQAYPALAKRWSMEGVSRAFLLGALVVVPVATALPNLPTRAKGFVDAGGVAPLVLLDDPPAVRGIVVTSEQAAGLVAAARYVRATTGPGEPVFVYPSSPLLYVMSERANPTRFAHLYPGAASPAALRDILAIMGEIPVRVVVVSGSALSYWGPVGANKVLEDYLAQRYVEVTRFGEYRVLVRGS